MLIKYTHSTPRIEWYIGYGYIIIYQLLAKNYLDQILLLRKPSYKIYGLRTTQSARGIVTELHRINRPVLLGSQGNIFEKETLIRIQNRMRRRRQTECPLGIATGNQTGDAGCASRSTADIKPAFTAFVIADINRVAGSMKR